MEYRKLIISSQDLSHQIQLGFYENFFQLFAYFSHDKSNAVIEDFRFQAIVILGVFVLELCDQQPVFVALIIDSHKLGILY